MNHTEQTNEEDSLLFHFVQASEENVLQWPTNQVEAVLEFMLKRMPLSSLSITHQRAILRKFRLLVSSMTLPLTIHKKIHEIVHCFKSGALELLYASPLQRASIFQEMRVIESCVNERNDAVRRTIRQHINSTMHNIPQRSQEINLEWLFKLHHLKDRHKKRTASLQNQLPSSSISSLPLILHENRLAFHTFYDTLSHQCVYSNENTISLPLTKEMKVELEFIVDTTESERFVSTSNVLDTTESYLQFLYHSILPPSPAESRVVPSHQTNSSLVSQNFSTTCSKDNEIPALQTAPQEPLLDLSHLQTLRLQLHEVEKHTSNFNHSQSCPDLSLLQSTPHLREVCEYLKLDSVSDEVLLRVCRAVLTSEFSHTRCCIFFSTTFLPKMKALQQLASRVFVSAVRECARSYPQAFLEAVLVPLLRSSTLNSHQAELLKTILSECLPKDCILSLLRSILSFPLNSEERAWNDVTIGLLLHILGMQLDLNEEVVRLFVLQLQRQARTLTANLSFTGLIFHFVKKYPTLAKQNAEILREVLKQCSTFLAKKTLTLLTETEEEKR